MSAAGPGAPGRAAPLDPAPLASLVAPTGPLAGLEVVDVSGSTSTDLAAVDRSYRETSGRRLPAPLLLAADTQLEGRGRAGRAWATPPRSALTSTLLVEVVPPVPDAVTWLPLLVGLGVVRALRDVAGVPAALKWPNDVVVLGGDPVPGWDELRKVGGILVEGLPAPSDPSDPAGETVRALVGVGVNVDQDASELPVPWATSLALAGARTTDRATLLRAQTVTTLAVLDAWQSADDAALDALQAEVAAATVTLGRRVRVEGAGGDALEGLAVGLGPGGELVVQADDGTLHLHTAGDVRHVRLPGGTSLGA